MPVALIFDYPENPEIEKNTNIMNQFGVTITVRVKRQQNTLCIVIKGIEKYVGKYQNTYLNEFIVELIPIPKKIV